MDFDFFGNKKRQEKKSNEDKSLKDQLLSKINTFFRKKSATIDLTNSSEPNNDDILHTTDLKQCVLELRVVCTLFDKIKKSSGLQFEMKIGEELVAKWFESKNANGKYLKKIRFPFKFKYLNSQISMEVNPIPDDDTVREINQSGEELSGYTIYHGLFNYNLVLQNELVMTAASETPVQLDQRNVIHLSMQEIKSYSNITIKFMIQLPSSEKYLLYDHNIKAFEDQGIYFSKVKIISQELVNDQTISLQVCIPNYDEEQFKERQFVIHFEDQYQMEDSTQSFLTPGLLIRGIFKIQGEDLQLIEQMQDEQMTKAIAAQGEQPNPQQSIIEEVKQEVQQNSDSYHQRSLSQFVEIIDETNPYLTVPKISRPIFTSDMQVLGKALLLGPISSEQQSSLTSYIAQGSVQVMPIIAVDFSLANLTFSNDQCLHSTKLEKQNDYRDIIRAICDSYSNTLNIPIFGYSAKTLKASQKAAPLFPLSRDLRNPFISNNDDVINEQYTKCLKELELSTPITLTPLFSLIKTLGQNVKKQISEKNNKVDSFYVLYILSAGLIDDLTELLNSIGKEWEQLPIQVHLINLSANNIVNEDLDTTKFQDYTMKFNLQQSCWLQFNVHFYDKLKAKYSNRSEIALSQLKEQAIESVAKEIEVYLFINQLLPNKYSNKSELVQSTLQNIIDVIEEKNKVLFEQAADNDIDASKVSALIDEKRLFEWSLDTLQLLMSNQNSNT